MDTAFTGFFQYLRFSRFRSPGLGFHSSSMSCFLHLFCMMSLQMQGLYPYSTASPCALSYHNSLLEIELTNTLRNLLGPYHRPKGEFGECWPGYGMPNLPWLGAVSDQDGSRIEDWANHREPDTEGWTEAYLQVSFGINGISLTTEI
jgi:hypothetical protein